MAKNLKSQEDSSANSNTKRDIRARGWVGTYFPQSNFEETIIEFEKYCKKQAKEYVFQRESTKSQNLHIQWYIWFKHQKKMSEITNRWPGIHCEKADNIEACRRYCSKSETSIGETFSNIKTIEDPMRGRELKWWQSAIKEIIKEKADHRTIHWYYDRIGGVGKTSFAKHLCLTNKNILYISGKASDVKFAVSKWIQAGKDIEVIIYGVPRTLDENEKVSYQALEEVKDGIFFSTKFESEMKIYNCPHVFVFSNAPPVQNNLSKTKWNIVDITETTQTPFGLGGCGFPGMNLGQFI